MLEKVKKYQDQWESLPDGAKQIAELIAIRKALQSEILDDDGNMISLWDYAINRELEVLSAETGFARDTDEDPEDVRTPITEVLAGIVDKCRTGTPVPFVLVLHVEGCLFRCTCRSCHPLCLFLAR